MSKSNKNLTMILFAFVVVALAAFSQSYSVPTYLSPKDVAEWVIAGGQIASGSAIPTATESIDTGSLYVDVSTPTAPVLYRFDGSDWQAMSSAGSSEDVPNNASFTLLGLGEKDFSSLDSTPTTLDGYGITDAALDASLTAHIDDTVNPHGEEMTIETSLTIGDSTATPTGTIDSPVDGAIRIASFTILATLDALPDLASGGICFLDDNYFYFCNGATWTKFEP